MNVERRQNLRHMFAGYLHQDWAADFASSEEAIRAFIENEPNSSVRLAHEEIAQLLTKNLDEDGWRKKLHQLGCYYVPGRHGKSVPDWLKDVERILAASLS